MAITPSRCRLPACSASRAEHGPAQRLGIEPLAELVMANGLGKQLRGLSGAPVSAPPA